MIKVPIFKLARADPAVRALLESNNILRVWRFDLLQISLKHRMLHGKLFQVIQIAVLILAQFLIMQSSKSMFMQPMKMLWSKLQLQ